MEREKRSQDEMARPFLWRPPLNDPETVERNTNWESLWRKYWQVWIAMFPITLFIHSEKSHPMYMLTQCGSCFLLVWLYTVTVGYTIASTTRSFQNIRAQAWFWPNNLPYGFPDRLQLPPIGLLWTIIQTNIIYLELWSRQHFPLWVFLSLW